MDAEQLYFIPLDVLYAARANASVTDMYKYFMINEEIYRRCRVYRDKKVSPSSEGQSLRDSSQATV